MKSIFKATAILGSSSAISVFVGLASSKLWAVLVGPSGLGYLAMLQSLLGLSALISGLGVNTGVVRMGAKAIADEDRISIAANLKSAIFLSIAGGTIGIIVLFLFSNVINRVVLDNQATNTEISLIGIALFFTLIANIFIGILNAHHKVKTLAKVGIINTVLSTGFLLVCVWQWRTAGIITGLIGGAIINCLTNLYFSKTELKKSFIPVASKKLKETSAGLLRFGIPFTASMLVGTGIQLILPSLILHQLGLESVGYYRAAAAISVTSLGVILTAMAQDYYPRLSAISDDPRELVETINQQLFLSVVLLSPILLWLLSLSSIVVTLLYSSKFAFTVEILNWMLVGDIFKVLSWTLSFVILARSSSSLFFLAESFGGATSLITTLIGMHLFGVKGLGISYLTTYFLFYLLVLFIIRRQINLRYSRENKYLVLFTLASALCISILSTLEYTNLRNVFALIICPISLGISLYIIRKHIFLNKAVDNGALN